MSEGDMVWINNPTVGTWASHIVTDEANLDVMPNRADLEVEMLSLMSCYHTAYHLLNDFVQLAPGDVILQTGATSTVSQITMAMARSRGVKLFASMQSGRTEHDLLISRFKVAGAHAVVPYTYLRGNYMRRLLSDLPAPRLMLNHVGGLKASSMVKLLGNDGVCVSYGSALSKPLQVANLDIITKGLKFKGFFLPKWNAANSREKRMRIHQNIVESMTLAQGHTYVRAMRYKFDTDSAFAFTTAWDSALCSRKPVLRMIGEYGEWRRPRPEMMAFQLGRACWEDILQELWESAATTETPQSMKYYTPFKDWCNDFVRPEQAKEVGHRDLFLRRPNMPRHNIQNVTTTTTTA
jgi:NADPH:quinone reductase-like Zn-dependent oxidoreductase